MPSKYLLAWKRLFLDVKYESSPIIWMSPV